MTPIQKRVFDYIARYIRAGDGSSPTYDQIARGCGIASKGNVHRIVKVLFETGVIRRTPHHARSIEIVDRALFRPDVEDALRRYATFRKTTRETVIAEAVASYLGIEA